MESEEIGSDFRPRRSDRRNRRRRRQGRGSSSLLPVLAGFGLVALLAAIAVISYLTVGPGGMRAGQASQTPGTRTLAALASGDHLALAPRQPLPGNPALAERLAVAVAGDMMFDRRVSDLIDSEGGKEPLAAVAGILSRAEIAVANLETPLSRRGSPAAGKDVTFEGNPKAIEGMSAAGIDFVSLANNHALDYGPDALADTMDLLDENKILYAGAGGNRKEAWSPAVKALEGKRVAFLGFSYIQPGGFLAGEDSAGIAGAKGVSGEIAAAIKNAKKRADFVIVSFHWGVEYTDHPVDEQEELGRLAIDAGADLVASHHPHVIQGIEVYKGKLIAYSLGDFVFDHYSRKTGEAFILQTVITPRKTLSARAIPVYLTESGKPEVVTGEDAQAILGRLEEISRGFGTEMRIEDDVAVLQLK